MRTTIDIDDAVVAEAMAVTGLPSKRATVEQALRFLVQRDKRRRAIEGMAGMGWGGDLDASEEAWDPGIVRQ